MDTKCTWEIPIMTYSSSRIDLFIFIDPRKTLTLSHEKICRKCRPFKLSFLSVGSKSLTMKKISVQIYSFNQF